MKKMLLALFVLALLFSATAALAADILVGVAMPTQSLQRWNEDGANMKKILEVKGYKVDLQYAENNVSVQISQLENMITKGVKVMIIASIDGSALSDVLAKAAEAKIPVIAYDRLIRQSPNVDYYATFDNFKVGVIQGKFIEEKLGLKEGKGPFNIEFFGGSPDDNNAKLFRAGQMKAIQPQIDAGKIEIVGDNWADGWSPKKAREITENLLVTVGKDIDVIVASNDGTAGGVIQALKAQGLDGKVLVSGQDADLQACKRILDGTQAMTVYKPLKKLATRGAQLAVQLAKGEDVAATQTVNNGLIDVPSVLLDPISLDKTNLVEVLTADGYYTEEALRN